MATSASTHRVFHWRDWMPLFALAGVVLLFSALGWSTGRGNFFSTANLCLILCDSSTITVAALGMMLIIAAGGIDLSAGAILGLCTAVLAVTLKRMIPAGSTDHSALLPLGCMALAVLTGALCGGLNGLLITRFRVMPFIVTLGTMSAFLGLGLLLSDEKTVTPAAAAIPKWFEKFVSASGFRYAPYPQAPGGILLEGLLAIVLAVVVSRTVFGRHVLAVGANEQAARLCGIRVGWIRTAVYTLGGALFGLAGVYQFALVRNYTANTGQGKELDIIAAVVIGGGSLKGGKATVLGTLVGSLLMATIRSGCVQLSIPNRYQPIILGLIIIGAVLFDRATSRQE